MIKVLKNTLEIIGKLNNCSSGYLLKYDNPEILTLASFGVPVDISGPFGELLNNLSNNSILTDKELREIPGIKELAEENLWRSAFVKEIPNDISRTKYFIALFSVNSNNFTGDKNSQLIPLIDNFYNILKGYQSAFLKTVKEARAGNLYLQDNRILNSLFEASEDFIFILDKDGYIKNVNEYGAACLNYEPRELEGVHLIDLVVSKNKQVLAESFHKLIEEEKLVSFELILLSKFGNEIIFQVNCKRLINSSNEFNIIGIGKNVTELRNYEEKIKELNVRLIEANRIVHIEKQRSKRQKAILAELNRMKSEFVSNISHELRTPLASIIGFSETILSDPEMPEEMRNEFNEIILNEGKRLAKLINEMLDISRLEGGQIELVKNDFDVVKLIEEAIEANTKALESKEMILTKELPAEAVIIRADREKIFRVFNNILNNAVKFTPHKGRITVTAQSLYKEFEVAISDTGAGIPEKDLPYIFQKFYRVSRPGTEIPGTGLGLVFVKQIVDLHKGFITIQSEINKGTTVIIKLPKDSKV